MKIFYYITYLFFFFVTVTFSLVPIGIGSLGPLEYARDVLNPFEISYYPVGIFSFLTMYIIEKIFPIFYISHFLYLIYIKFHLRAK